MVDLAEDGNVLLINFEQRLVGCRAHFRLRALDVDHELASGKLLDLPVYIQREGITIGDGVVEGDQCCRAVHIFDVDYLFFRLAQGMGFLKSQGLQPITIVTCGL